MLSLLLSLSPPIYAAPAPAEPRVVSVNAGGPPAQSCREALGLAMPKAVNPATSAPYIPPPSDVDAMQKVTIDGVNTTVSTTSTVSRQVSTIGKPRRGRCGHHQQHVHRRAVRQRLCSSGR